MTCKSVIAAGAAAKPGANLWDSSRTYTFTGEEPKEELLNPWCDRARTRRVGWAVPAGIPTSALATAAALAVWGGLRAKDE